MTEPDQDADTGRSWWVSWYADKGHGPFTLNWPWWISGCDADGNDTICAAVQAEGEAQVKDTIVAAYDQRPESIRWRFVESRPADWSPFSDRFPRAEWMMWPVQIDGEA